MLFKTQTPDRPSPTADRAVNGARGRHAPPNVIAIRQRSLTMMKKDLLMRNPLRQLGYETEDILETGAFGAILARAGLGKTAFLVQIALHTMLRDRNVLHISLDDPVDKVTLWYQEVFNLMVQSRQANPSPELWNGLLPHRFVMTFKVEGFSVPKLRERLTDLTQQDIFHPHTLIIDGLPFDGAIRGSLEELKALCADTGIRSWFTVRTHRHEDPGPDGLPPQLTNLQDLFAITLQLLPDGQDIHIRQLKGASGTSQDTPLRFDPATMLIKTSV
jgi:hypothetical protein